MVRHVDKGNICVHVQTEIHGSLFILDIFTYEHHKGSNSRLNEYTTDVLPSVRYTINQPILKEKITFVSLMSLIVYDHDVSVN